MMTIYVHWLLDPNNGSDSWPTERHTLTNTDIDGQVARQQDRYEVKGVERRALLLGRNRKGKCRQRDACTYLPGRREERKRYTADKKKRYTSSA
jgi:hypothetical protein